VNSYNRSIDYDEVKDIYDLVRIGDPELVHQLLNEVSVKSDSLVLDVGCGTANNTLLFRKVVNADVLGVDLSYGMLSKAVEKREDLDFIHSPAENLPFKANVFDFIFMIEVIHHLNDISSAVSEIYKILKTNCPLCIVTQSHEQIEHRMTSRFFPTTVPVDKNRYPRIDKLRKLLLSAGFHEVYSKSYEFATTALGTEYLHTVEMRGYSMLHKITDVDYERGLKSLKSALSHDEDLQYTPQYTFVWARK
jgi:ubiquinone/menaquinone biosynthesis C-methylase UbiE